MNNLQRHSSFCTATMVLMLMTNVGLTAEDSTGTGQTLIDMCETDSKPTICIAEKTQALCAEAPDSQECMDAIATLRELENK